MKDLMKRFLLWVLQGLIVLVFVGFFAVILVEWFAGCGQTYIDAKGKAHTNKCLFLSTYR